jgi:hypothetical protein
MISKKEAKRLALEVWRYLAKHPGIPSKFCLPLNLRLKIVPFRNLCSLCSVFLGNCHCCPLGGCAEDSTDYQKWFNSERRDTRKKAAQAIVDKIKAWEVEE